MLFFPSAYSRSLSGKLPFLYAILFSQYLSANVGLSLIVFHTVSPNISGLSKELVYRLGSRPRPNSLTVTQPLL